MSLIVDSTTDVCSSTCRPGHELIYEFSEYTCSLNEMEDGIAPTDSRLRPDQRIMENGDFDGANTEKVGGGGQLCFAVCHCVCSEMVYQ